MPGVSNLRLGGPCLFNLKRKASQPGSGRAVPGEGKTKVATFVFFIFFVFFVFLSFSFTFLMVPDFTSGFKRKICARGLQSEAGKPMSLQFRKKSLSAWLRKDCHRGGGSGRGLCTWRRPHSRSRRRRKHGPVHIHRGGLRSNL